jgi:hypothetical protein
VLLVLLVLACDKITLPRMGFDTKDEPPLPVTITYAFDQNLLNYTHTINSCGLTYTIPVGQIIVKTFFDVGQDRFNGVRAEPPIGQAQGAPPNGYRIVLSLNHFGFDPVNKTGDEDRYIARVDLQMQAIYEDDQGIALAKSPLTYHHNASLWTPALSGQSTSCSTGAIDDTVENAAETLAKDMIGVIPQLAQPAQFPVAQQPSTGQRLPTQPGLPNSTSPFPHTPSPSPHTIAEPSVQFRTKLVDANRNLILEGGEVVVLLIETTNVSSAKIPSAYVEIRGNPIIVEAFKRVAPIPVPIGALQPGEKRTTEIRGRLPKITGETNGELIIGIILSAGLPPGTHTIHFEIQPRPSQRNSTR